MKIKWKNRLIAVVMLTVFGTSLFLPFVPEARAAKVINVTVKDTFEPGYYWCQHIDGHWSTSSTIDGVKTAPDAGGVPQKTRVKTGVSTPFPTTGWEDPISGNTYILSEVDNPHIVNPVVLDPIVKALTNGVTDVENGVATIDANTGKGTIEPIPYSCGNGRAGLIYEFPIEVTFEGTITIKDGTANIKHFTEGGSSLSSVFNDRTVPLVVDQPYYYEHPTHADYEYIGYKKSTTGSAPTGAIEKGDPPPDPPSFDYDGSFPTYNLHFYYRLKNGGVPEPSPSPSPEYSITGDFDILPSQTINWRDSFSLKPKNFVIPSGCTYQYHEFRIERNGSTWTSGRINSKTAISTFNYGSYPFNIGVGSHDVTLKITATCADSGWIASKMLTVNGPASNGPPVFKAGWTTPGQWKQSAVQTKVVVSTYLDLVYLDDPVPTDPDGDSITFVGFDFSASNTWAKQIPSEYSEFGNGYHQILMDTPGFYCGKATMRDSFGADSSQTVCVDVVPPNPIPVITVPPSIRENHPVTPEIHGNKSYSPMNRTIDHARDIWTNRKSVYTTAGPQTVTLDVFDNEGLKSLAPDSVTFNVLPDEPPVPVLNVQPRGIRQTTYDIFNNSYTTDGDIIVTAAYRYKYDIANDGFTNDTWNAMVGTLAKTTLKPAKVGKYQIEVTVTENYGKAASTTVILDTINQAPSVSFLVEGENEIPEPANKKLYTGTEIFNSWSLYQTNTNTKLTSKNVGWSANDVVLSASLGKLGEKIKTYYMSYTRYSYDYYKTWADPMQNNGLGSNTLNSYRAIAGGSVVSEPLVSPKSPLGSNLWYPNTFSAENGMFLRTNKSHIYYIGDNYQSNGKYFMALNKSKIGNYYSQSTPCDGCWFPSRDHKFVNDVSPFDFILDPTTIPFTRPKTKVGNWLTWDAWVNRDYSKLQVYNSQQDVYGGEVVAYEVSDRTVYQLVKWSCESCSSITGYSSRVSQPMMDLRSYDASTGELIQSTALKGVDITGATGEFQSGSWGTQRYLYTRGDNLILFVNNKALEFSRNGDLLKSVSVPYPTHNLYRGPNGEWYGYSVSRPGDPNLDASYVFKINPDYSIGWNVKLAGKDPNFGRGFAVSAFGDPSDSQDILMINSIKGEVVARSYTSVYMTSDVYYQAIDMATGALSNYDYTTYGFTSESSNVDMTWTGDYKVSATDSMRDIYTPDGYRTSIQANGQVYVYDANNSIVSSFSSGGTIESGYYWTTTNAPVGGTYVGDGIYLLFYTYSSGPYQTNGSLVPWIVKGTPTSNAAPYKGFQIGQFVSNEVIDNSELTWTMNMFKPSVDNELAGMSFRMTDPRNRYALETNGSVLYLSKYVNGARTELGSIPFTFQPKTDYSFKVNVQGDRIEAFVNGVPYFDITDNTFTSGKFGPFSDKAYVDFSNIARIQLSTPTTEWLTNYAIWDAGAATADVRYSNIVYSDPETDPIAGNYQWSIAHTPKFLNNQGLSTLNGQTRTSPALTFDKVGNYRVTLKAQDDPNPVYLFPKTEFADYRKWSNDYWQIITVHRRPISQYSLTIKPSDKSVLWNNTSYDPDRWVSSSNYSTENTGVNYQTTRGVLERKYYYITPSGTKVNQMLVTPQEVGTYSVGMQVKDEYGAWSYWNEQQISIATPAIPDQPPVAGFTVTPSTGYVNTTFTFKSTAYDVEDGVAANLQHVYYVRNLTEGSSETVRSSNRGTWTTSFSSLGVIEIRQVVTDSKGQTAQLIKQVTILNRPPVANFDWSPKPVYEGDVITITNLSTDPDGDLLSYSWFASGPNGFSQSAVTKNIMLNAVDSRNNPGTFTIKLTVNDSRGASTSVTKTITVLPLGIQGYVRHTDAWEANRLHYNENNPSEQRPAHWFWAGEAFVLEATVTDTGSSATKPVSVEASATSVPALSKSLLAVDVTAILWRALLREGDTSLSFEELPEGVYSFVFTVTYSNGVVKTSTVPIRIQDTVDHYVQVHRIQ